MPRPKYTRFDIYWWVASDGSKLCRFATRGPNDIEQFNETHFRIKAHSFDSEDDDIELILRRVNAQWTCKCDSFENISEDYPFAFASTDEGAVWIDALDDELMVIRATA